MRRRPADLSFLEESTGRDGLRSDTQVFLFSSVRNTMSACSVETWEELITTQLVITAEAWLVLISQPTEEEITFFPPMM